MGNIKEQEEIQLNVAENDPLIYIDINVNKANSHIEFRNPAQCKKCTERPCITICPSFVYRWTGEIVEFSYQRCIECGACKLVCPNNNILFDYPAGGYGVVWEY